MLLTIGGVIGLLLLVAVAACSSTPAFYRDRLSRQDGPAAAQARRLLSKMSALHADMGRPGRWEAAVTETEINAWLATDLSANHASVLPAGWSEPRVELTPHRCRVGVRIARGPWNSVLSIDARIQLREVNQVWVTLDDARLGVVPLPHGPILGWLATRLSGLGMLPQSRRLDGRTVLVVYISRNGDAGAATSLWLEALAVGPGELLLSGETRVAAGSR